MPGSSKDAEGTGAGGASFQCSVCLDTATDPVVTKCGHLFCWPCLDRWLASAGRDHPSCCPVCKGALSTEVQGDIIPVYGKGRPTADKAKDTTGTTPAEQNGSPRPAAASPNTTGSSAGSSSPSSSTNARPRGNREDPPPQANNGGWGAGAQWIPQIRSPPFLFLTFGFGSGILSGVIPLLMLAWFFIPQHYRANIGYGRMFLILLLVMVLYGAYSADVHFTYNATPQEGSSADYSDGQGGEYYGASSHRVRRQGGSTGRR